MSTSPDSRPDPQRLALVLPGGGARSAYQVGVLKAISELLPRDSPVPFRTITGTSAGAIISATVAAHALHFREGAVSLERFWRNFHVDQVYRADAVSVLRSGLHWLLALISGGWLVPPPRSVFDNRPLRDTLERHVNFARVQQALESGHLDALAINASAYRSALSVAFYQCAGETPPWVQAWRLGLPTELGHDHLMASAAVPFLFPAVQLAGEYYGDGAMRQVAPLSPAIHLGATRILIIGLRAPGSGDVPGVERAPTSPRVAAGALGFGPTFGQIFGFMLDTLFMDGLQSDLERLHRDNLLIEATGGRPIEGLRRIDTLQITPTEDFAAIAGRHLNEVPRALRILLRTMGAANASGRLLLSYMLFEGGYTRELIGLGYADAMARREELIEFIGPTPRPATHRRSDARERRTGQERRGVPRGQPAPAAGASAARSPARGPAAEGSAQEQGAEA